MGSDINEFNVIQFEKRLTSLKDSQELINACCKWCLENRQHHKKIVNSWLNVLKRVKVEQRLTLFYLANDVIQYSKRRQYEFVESWGTALQKATTLVRDEKVKHKVVRIFNIWQQRGVYNEEFISDLCGLISIVPTAAKSDEPHEFQSNYVTNKIKQCSQLEIETDLKLKLLKEHNPKIQIETESLCASLKDRAHVDDVEKEMEVYVRHLEAYINALKSEIKCRISNISVLKQAHNHLDKDKRDVKVVANAYKLFGNKVRAFQKKLAEHKMSLISPVPSPDINAPSPSPDCDIELPDDDETEKKKNVDLSLPTTSYNAASFTPGFYNPVPPPATEPSGFVTNGYTSFIGSGFSLENLNTSGVFTHTQTTSANTGLTEVTNSGLNVGLSNLSNVLLGQPPPPPEPVADTAKSQFKEPGHFPLQPPPMPPFSTKSDLDNSFQSCTTGEAAYASAYTTATTNFGVYETPSGRLPYNSCNTLEQRNAGFKPPDVSNAYPPDSEEYNPEQEPETWEPDASWTQPQMDATDTPESPPMFEKHGFVEGVEFHENVVPSGTTDVDHRVLRTLSADVESERGRAQDVDHRNLISLTGSPADTNSNISSHSAWNSCMVDKDYRTEPPPVTTDQDYRLSPFIEQLKLPPPPPPPPKSTPKSRHTDNTDSIDMELSEDETDEFRQYRHNMIEERPEVMGLQPPPPFPELPDDIDANTFLDDLNDELNSSDFGVNLQVPDQRPLEQFPPPMLPPPMQNMAPFNFPPNNNWSQKQNANFNMRRGRGNWGIQRGGRGRGNFGFNRGVNNNFRGRGFGRGAARPFKPRGNMRGNFQGLY